MTSSQFGTKSFFCNVQYFFGPSWSKVATQLPDELSESEIPANSSRIKNNFWTNRTEAIWETIVSDFVPRLYEVTSRQLGERYGSCPFTCSRFGNKSDRENS